MERYESLNRL